MTWLYSTSVRATVAHRFKKEVEIRQKGKPRPYALALCGQQIPRGKSGMSKGFPMRFDRACSRCLMKDEDISPEEL